VELLNLRNRSSAMQGTIGDYTAAWQAYRRLRRKMFLVWLFFVPAVGAIATIGIALIDTFVPAMVIAVIWCFWLLLACGEFSAFSCPRCGAIFAGEGMWHIKYWIFARKCVNCDLKKYSGDSSC
jgi:hypothetical protein